MIDEKGYIKFTCQWVKQSPFGKTKVNDLIAWRNKLYEMSLIGCYDNGIGYGNISMRYDDNTFLITGSGTGQYNKLTEDHITLVSSYSFEDNSVTCHGPVKASSESLTHAIIYKICPDIRAVIHVHNLPFWKKYLNYLPTTHAEVEYGTPSMAWEVNRLFIDTDVKKLHIFVMGGHQEGIVSFGKNLEKAAEPLLRLYKGMEG